MAISNRAFVHIRSTVTHLFSFQSLNNQFIINAMIISPDMNSHFSSTIHILSTSPSNITPKSALFLRTASVS